MDINDQCLDIPVDSQLIPDAPFDIVRFVTEYDPSLGQTIQFLDGNVSFVEVGPADVLQSIQPDHKQEMELKDLNETLYDVNYELSVEELTKPGVDFNVKITETERNEMYTYSNQLNKMYTSIDKPCTFELSFNSNPTIQPTVRVMLVCTNSLYQPLFRCAHHTKNDNSESKNHVILRKGGPVEYIGMPEGQDFRDRLALKIPMGNSNRKNVTLEFKCLTSCHKIRNVSTALVFTLEDPASGELLGRKVLPIKVTKNFKRDMEMAEKANEKRTNETGGQKRKQSSNFDAGPVSPAPVAGSSKQQDAVSVDLSLKLPHGSATEFLKYAEQFFAAKLYGAGLPEIQELEPCLKKIKRLAADMEKSKDQ